MSSIAGARAVFLDGLTGFLVPPRNPDALAARLLCLLDRPVLRAEFGAAARQRVEREFTWTLTAGRTANLLAVLGMARGDRRLALGATGCWAWQTGHFCRRRLVGTRHTTRHIAEMLVTSVLIPPLSIYRRLRGAIAFRVVFL